MPWIPSIPYRSKMLKLGIIILPNATRRFLLFFQHPLSLVGYWESRRSPESPDLLLLLRGFFFLRYSLLLRCCNEYSHGLVLLYWPCTSVSESFFAVLSRAEPFPEIGQVIFWRCQLVLATET